jgi:steroid delta-isomerase-like uncharacterized protein
MSVKENQALMRWMYEESNNIKGNAAKIPAMVRKFMAPQSVYHGATGDMNFEQYKEYIAALCNAFPDMNWTVEDMFGVEDKVVTRYTISGTHNGPFMGIPATGKRFFIRSASIARFAGGKAAEGWGFPDMFSLMQQLGVIPSPTKK